MANSLVITTKPALDDVLLSQNDLAKRWGFKPQSLANMRSKGIGPRYYRLFNGTIRYPDWAVFEAEVGKIKA
ncbi:hypothetical protein LGH82_33075 [Mesorhizobium sp. PAMC28654]|uniref:hypothetical protein n=1 Tax=Mesorhizobium sp. PAMC28654 TaxID=2880934 RepID=UPI001D0AF195|nr:hypothetical protein [Mesorhizobium sp. PAMC28654]UDL89815.1 hypothetical protein LGH82_33075 [Mesorhizobium sp. PAMC28654]